MKERLHRVVEFWREHVFRYRALWALALVLHLLFFTLSGILPFFFKQVIDALTALDQRLFSLWIAVFLGTEITQVALMYARGYVARRLELKVEQDVQIAMYRRYHTMPYAQAVTTKAGEAVQRHTSDVPRASPLIVKSFAELVGHIVLVVIVLSLMFAMAPLLGGIALAFVAIYTAGFRLYGKRAPAAAGRRQEAEARYVATAEEGLAALYSVRVQVELRRVVDRFSRALTAYLREGFALYKLTLLFQGGFTTAITVASEVAVLLAGAWLIFRGEATVGTLVAFSQYVNWLYVFVGFMSSFAAEVEPAVVSLKRVQDVLSLPEHWTVEEPVRSAELPDHPYALEVRDLHLAVGHRCPAGSVAAGRTGPDRGRDGPERPGEVHAPERRPRPVSRTPGEGVPIWARCDRDAPPGAGGAGWRGGAGAQVRERRRGGNPGHGPRRPRREAPGGGPEAGAGGVRGGAPGTAVVLGQALRALGWGAQAAGTPPGIRPGGAAGAPR